jgi:hypothetical protein
VDLCDIHPRQKPLLSLTEGLHPEQFGVENARLTRYNPGRRASSSSVHASPKTALGW